ncbi:MULTISPECIES: ATP-binding protein [Parabacteroides]|uniref:AAA family ATPase n=1 Tax=Parabacteroides leei TaxID=2939491 RepID=UPI00189A933E|nr:MULTISPECIES: ATP-binding protein [Parabacteroides]MCL3850666.1 ATP-binding protein [Parabacteroides leei]
MINLIEFTVENFLSFKDKKTLSMEASNIKELPDNILKTANYKLLKSAAIYGANSSGKSNLIKALKFMQDTIMNSSKLNSTDKLNVSPFMLAKENRSLPSYFEILFIQWEEYYRYGFELDNDKIHSEWLYTVPKGAKKEQPLFLRENESIGISDIFLEAKGLEERTRDNGLFLSVCDQFNVKRAKEIIESINDIRILSGVNHDPFKSMTSVYLKNESKLTKKFFQDLQLGFIDIDLLNEEYNWRDKANTIHNIYDISGNKIGKHSFIITESESAGTNKVFDIAGFILYTLQYGLPLVIDELDAKLHPLLTKKIIEMFHSPEINKRGAQLIFATHDTNLLGCDCFRRDQIWFTEKDEKEQTDLYSLVEFRDPDGTKVRNDRNYEKDYIQGRYGAIPFIGDFSNLMKYGKED